MKKIINQKIQYCIVSFLFVLSTFACSQPKPDNNMKWISKYDFFDLYKIKVSGGTFNPGSAISLEKIVVPDEKTIILGAEKMVWKFKEDKKGGSIAVLFVSNDKGKSYKEIDLKDKDLSYLETKGDYTYIETFSMDDKGIKKYKIALLNNKTFNLETIAEYLDSENISYKYFDGKYGILSNGKTEKLINFFNNKEEYDIPEYLSSDKIQYYNTGDGKLVYKQGQEIIEYKVKTKEKKVINKLSRNYNYYWGDENLLVIKHDEPYRLELFDLNENKKFELNKENRNYYRYKNFMCDYSKIGPKPIIRFSYDYGKTWQTHNVEGFTILQNIFGFYKDQFLVTEGIFWHFDSPESGGRIMVGEFEK